MRLMFIFLSLGLLSGCSMFYDREVQWETVPPKTFPVLKAIGYAPLAEQKADSAEQRMLMAIKASQKRSSSCLGSLSVGSTIKVPATGNETVGAWKP